MFELPHNNGEDICDYQKYAKEASDKCSNGVSKQSYSQILSCV